MSTTPGRTHAPEASTSRAAAPGASRSTTVTTPSCTPTSARRGAAPVPSSTVPPRIARSSMGADRTSPGRLGGRGGSHAPGGPALAPPPLPARGAGAGPEGRPRGRRPARGLGGRGEGGPPRAQALRGRDDAVVL